MQNTHESDKTRLESVAPVIRLNNRTMQPSLDLFIEKLGFQLDTVRGSPPKFAMVKRDSLVVILECRRTIPWKQSGWAIYFWVNEAKGLRQEIVENGLDGVSELVEKEYGCVEFKVPLPDARSLVFGQILSPVLLPD